MRRSGGVRPLFSSVLCPVDFSDHSRVALEFAAAISTRAGGTLQLLFVNDPLLVAAAAAAYNTASLGAATEVELKRFAASTLSPRRLATASPGVSTALGKPGREILRAVDRGQHDAIVMGSKGLNGARRLLLGSTGGGGAACLVTGAGGAACRRLARPLWRRPRIVAGKEDRRGHRPRGQRGTRCTTRGRCCALVRRVGGAAPRRAAPGDASLVLGRHRGAAAHSLRRRRGGARGAASEADRRALNGAGSYRSSAGRDCCRGR